MQLALFKKCLSEAALLLAACALGMLGFTWLRVWLVSRLELGAFAKVIEQVWDKYDKFSPVDLGQLVSYYGRVALTYSEPIVVLCMSVWCIARGSDAISGEISRGTMEILLSQPVSRRRVLWTQASVTVGGVALLALIAWVGVAAGIHTCQIRERVSASFTIPGLPFSVPNPLGESREVLRPMSAEIAAAPFAHAAGNLFCFGVCLAGLATLASSLDRYRWRTIGLLVSWLVLQMIARLVAATVDWLAWLNYATVFWVYEPEIYVQAAVNHPEQLWQVLMENRQGTRFAPLGANLVLLSLGLGGYAGATAIFGRRDLPAPL